MRLDSKTVHAPEIGPVWLNSPPLSLRQLRGRVVLLDSWDFTCVNRIRTLPYAGGAEAGPIEMVSPSVRHLLLWHFLLGTIYIRQLRGGLN